MFVFSLIQFFGTKKFYEKKTNFVSGFEKTWAPLNVGVNVILKRLFV